MHTLPYTQNSELKGLAHSFYTYSMHMTLTTDAQEITGNTHTKIVGADTYTVHLCSNRVGGANGATIQSLESSLHVQ